MKQFRLLMTLFALMLGWTNVSAQTWTGSEVGEGKALLYNVGTGMYLTRGNGWNTQASIGSERAAMTVLLENYDGKYKIRTNVNGDGKGFEHLNGGTVYSDQSVNKNSTWSFINVGTQDDPVYNIISADNHGGGADIYLTAEGGESTIVGPGTDATVDKAKWKIYLIEDQKAKVLSAMPDATESNPIDATVLIGNPDFNTAIAPTGQPWTMDASNQNLSGGATLSNPCAESWRAAFTLSQTISVPNGQYKLRAQAAMTEYTVTGNDLPVVYLNDATVPFNAMTEGEDALATMSANFAAGKYYTEYTDVVTVTSGSITIGARGTRTDTWCTWDNFQLQYLGALADLTPFIEGLAAAVEAAQAVEGTVPAAIYQQIDAVVTANNKEWSTADDYSAAIQAINNAVAQYATADIISNYSRYKTIKAAVLAIDNTINTQEADDQADRATTTEGIDSAIATVRGALTSYLAENATNLFSEGRTIDVTSALIDNATPVSNANYWTVSVTPKFDAGNNCAEFWNQKGATMSQTLAAMPTGIYQLSVVALTRTDFDASIFANDNSKTIVGVGYDVVDNRAQANTWFNNGNGVNALDFNTLVDGDIAIGLNAASNTSDYWTVWRSFQLIYKGVDLTSFQPLLDEAVTAATSLEGKIPSAAYTELMSVVNENNKTYTTAEGYQSALAAIATALETANALVTPYSLYQIAKTNVVAIKSQTTYTDEGNVAATQLDTDVAAADAANEAATTVEAINAAIRKVRIAASTFAGSVTIKQGQYLDLTDAMLFNADMRTDGCLDLWNIVSNTNPSYPKYRVNCSEFWGANFDFNQTALQMPKGNYNIEVYAFHRAAAEGSTYHTYLYANDESVLVLPITNGENSMEAADQAFSEGKYLNSLKLTLDAATDVVIGFKNEDTAEDLRESGYPTDKWTIFRDFKIKFFGDDALAVYREEYESALAEAEAALASEDYANITGNEKTALTTAVTETYPKSVVETNETQEKFEEATTALKEATTVFKNAKAAYDAYATAMAAAANYKVDYPYASADKLSVYQNNLVQVTTAADASSTAAAIISSYRLYVESNALAEGVEDAVDMTSKILNNNNPENTDNWSSVLNLGENNATFVVNSGQPYTAGDGTIGGKYFDGGATTWGNGNWEAKISQDIMLAPGTYVLSVTSRAQANVNKYNLFAGENKVEMGHIGSAAEAGIFGNGFNDYYVTFDVTAENPTITIGIEVGAEEAYTWYSFSRFRLARIEDRAVYATDVELTALAQALQPTAQLGFDEGDYAPYNNVENLTTAEAEIAKVYAEMEVFGGKATQATVLAATQVISQLNWTANTEEVNAIYDGTLANAPIQATSENVVLPGWKTKVGNTRQTFKGTGEDGKACLADANDEVGLFVHPGTYTYGETAGYTMPLKAGVTYTAEAKYCSWQSGSNKDFTLTILKDGATIATHSFGANNAACTEAEALKHVTLNFKPENDGDYVLNLVTSGNTFMTDFFVMRAKFIPGDVNGDQEVNIADVTALVNALQKGGQPAAGDLDGVEGVTGDDVKALVDLILHNE